jgi:hypothetical protein
VRANVIWAKEIKAEEIRCGHIKLDNIPSMGGGGPMRIERVDATVLRAQKIRAHTVEAAECHVEKIGGGGGGGGPGRGWGRGRKDRD